MRDSSEFGGTGEHPVVIFTMKTGTNSPFPLTGKGQDGVEALVISVLSCGLLKTVAIPAKAGIQAGKCAGDLLKGCISGYRLSRV